MADAYNIYLKNLLPHIIHNVAVIPDEVSGIQRVKFEPHETLRFDEAPREVITDQMWNLIEKERVLLRVCGVRVWNRFESWPDPCASVTFGFVINPIVYSELLTSISLNASVNVDGIVYAVAVPDGASAPTAAEVIAGQASGGGAPIAAGSDSVAAAELADITLSGLSPGTAYDIYVTAQSVDTNVIDPPVLLNASTVPTLIFSISPSITASNLTSFSVEAGTNLDSTIYAVAVPDGDPAPNFAEVKAGQRSGGAAAVASDSEAATAGVAEALSLTGLQEYTDYDLYFVAESTGPSQTIAPVLVEGMTDFTVLSFSPAPSIDAFTDDSFDVLVGTNIGSLIYAVVVADGDPTPSVAQIAAGDNAFDTPALAAASDVEVGPAITLALTGAGIDPGMDYDIHVAAISSGPTQEIQTKIDGTTSNLLDWAGFSPEITDVASDNYELLAGIPQNNGLWADDTGFYIFYSDANKNPVVFSGETLATMSTKPLGFGTLPELANARGFSCAFRLDTPASRAVMLYQRDTEADPLERAYWVASWDLTAGANPVFVEEYNYAIRDGDNCHVSLAPEPPDNPDYVIGICGGPFSAPNLYVRQQAVADLSVDTDMQSTGPVSQTNHYEMVWAYRLLDGWITFANNQGGGGEKAGDFGHASEWIKADPAAATDPWGAENVLEQVGVPGEWADQNYAVPSTSAAGQMDCCQTDDRTVWAVYIDNTDQVNGAYGNVRLKRRDNTVGGSWSTVRLNVLPPGNYAWHIALQTNGTQLAILYIPDNGGGSRDTNLKCVFYNPSTDTLSGEFILASAQAGHRFERIVAAGRLSDVFFLWTETDDEVNYDARAGYGPWALSGPPNVISIGATEVSAVGAMDGPGTIYGVAVPDGDPAPTATEIKAGQASGGGAAVSAANVAVTAFTPEEFTFTGLQPLTVYDFYFVGSNGGTDTPVSSVLGVTTIDLFVSTVVDGPTLAQKRSVGLPQNNGIWKDASGFYVFHPTATKGISALSGPDITSLSAELTGLEGVQMGNPAGFSMAVRPGSPSRIMLLYTDESQVAAGDRSFRLAHWDPAAGSLGSRTDQVFTVTDKENAHVHLAPSPPAAPTTWFGCVGGPYDPAVPAVRANNWDLSADVGVGAMGPFDPPIQFPEACWVFELTDGIVGMWNDNGQGADDPVGTNAGHFIEVTKTKVGGYENGTQAWSAPAQLEQVGVPGEWADQDWSPAAAGNSSHGGQMDFLQTDDLKVYAAYVSNGDPANGNFGQLRFKVRDNTIGGSWSILSLSAVPDNSDVWQVALQTNGTQVAIVYIRDNAGARETAIHCVFYDPGTDTYSAEYKIADVKPGNRNERVCCAYRNSELLVYWNETSDDTNYQIRVAEATWISPV